VATALLPGCYLARGDPKRVHSFALWAHSKAGTMNRSVGLIVIFGGACVLIVGLLIYSGALSWFGRLPGDIRYEGEHTRVYVPIVSSLLLSLVLSLLFYLFRRFF
jgi:hypothetical protein